MKLIDKESILKNLPLEIGTEQILILDSLRFAFEIIDHSYEKLTETLLEISKSNQEKNVPATFGYAWSIVDTAIRLLNICKQLPKGNETKIIEKLYYLKDFRHSYQHLDERIRVSLLTTKTPFFGVISWVYKYPGSKDFIICQLVSGNLLIGPNAKQKVPDLTNSNEELNAIRLHSVNNKAETIETDLIITMINLKQLAQELEKRIELHCKKYNLFPHKWTREQDMTFIIKNPK